MFVHRWMTLSHIISTTKLDWCNKKAVDETGDGTLDKEAIEFVSALQRDNTTLQPTGLAANLNTKSAPFQQLLTYLPTVS